MTKRDRQFRDAKGRDPELSHRDRAKRRKLSYGGRGKEDDTARSPSGPLPTMLDGQVVPKLDQSDSVQARRIQQRRRMVMFGKNTVGYDEYIRQVPKHKRKPRCMEHPSTPDHTVDIPNRRWQGLLKAWRKALHKYDPPDLKTADAGKVKETEGETTDSKPAAVDGEKKASEQQSIQAKQIAEATSKGILVDFASASVNQLSSSSATAATTCAAIDSFDEEEERYQRMIQQGEEEGTDDLAKLGTTSARSEDFLLEDDSDDDLL